MSHIGKKSINIPEGVEVKIEGNVLKAKGPKGEGFLNIPDSLKVEISNNSLNVSPIRDEKDTKALWGTTRAHLNNLIKGLTQGFQKDLEIEGVGYRVNVEGKNLVLKVGYINPVSLEIPDDIEVNIEKNSISVSGNSKEKVGQFAANIKAVKPVEPYKGKGIHYKGERIRRKAGKKIATTTT
ncbi:50S ribosomal protein L6 [Candidatus Parcubacteria bacterium]|nr:50S ribosomal protein L6 [Candidatus Parcubacteria bacterium]